MDDIGGLLDGALAAEARETELVKKRGGIEIAEEKRADLIKLFNRIRATKDIDLILRGEKQCLKFELRKKANSDEMTASLEQAVKKIDVAIGTLDQVRHPEFYRAICKTQFELPKNQTRGGLPRDAARQFFRSHATRLKNLVASGIEASEKDVIRTRMDNNREAETLYVSMQLEVLEPSKELEAEPELER